MNFVAKVDRVPFDPNEVDVFDWINERHAIYLRKAKLEGQTPPSWATTGVEPPAGPWTLDYLTHDPVLRENRFCNVFRELDRVTIWIRKNIREPYADHQNLWFMLAIARTLNWPEAIQELIDEGAWPTGDYDPDRFAQVLDERMKRGDKVYTGAYMIRADSDPKSRWFKKPKHFYVAHVVLAGVWRHRYRFEKPLTSMEMMWERLRRKDYIGWGDFMSYQVIVDMRHTRLLCDATDISRFAAVGPGSARGLNRLAGRPLDKPVSHWNGWREMRELFAQQGERLAPWVPHMELSDIQNSLCEFDKWMRVQKGDGQTRARYVPGRGY